MSGHSEHYEKRKVQRRLHGVLTLDDPVQERAVYLLADGVPTDEVCRACGLSQEQIERFDGDPTFRTRLSYLKRKNENRKGPFTPDRQLKFAVTRLRRLGVGAKKQSDQIAACRSLGVLALDAMTQQVTTTDQPPKPNEKAVAELEKLFGEQK